ncbi:MAG: hypothetical protein FJ098_04185, partial [Deltaproteobacteria bacterium]|nr:hypothetical protein [Deltaproteobacteria bacterium]
DQDPTLVPMGKGAVFVPCMSDPELEPPWMLYQGRQQVASAATGTRIVVRPGTYRVILGSGPVGDRVVREVTVVEGKTAMVPPDWAGLQVQVVDENAIPFRGEYELVHLPGTQNYGVGRGAQIEQGERVRTWLLEPGLYMLLKVGESYQARSNFYTFRVRPGYLELLTLVEDATTGDFRGAGEQRAFGAGSALQRDLVLAIIVGGGVNLTSQSNVTGVADKTTLGPSFYFDTLLQYTRLRHYVYGRLNLQEAFTQEDWGRIEKNLDFWRLDGLYAYKLLPFLGPYVRAGIESTLFPGFLYFEDRRDVSWIQDGEPRRTWKDRRQFQVTDPAFPLVLKGGTGLRFNTPPLPWLDFWALLGVGGRFTFTSDMFTSRDDVATTAYEIGRIRSFEEFGAESTVLARASITRWVLLTTEAEVFAPFDDFLAPTFRWDNNLALRITSYVSISYIYRMKYEPSINGALQHDHQALLRFSYKFL